MNRPWLHATAFVNQPNAVCPQRCRRLNRLRFQPKKNLTERSCTSDIGERVMTLSRVIIGITDPKSLCRQGP
jgi:hypothetical protein